MARFPFQENARKLENSQPILEPLMDKHPTRGLEAKRQASPRPPRFTGEPRQHDFSTSAKPSCLRRSRVLSCRASARIVRGGFPVLRGPLGFREHVLRVQGKVLVDLAQHRRVLVSHQNGDR